MVVISLNIINYDVCYICFDNGSSIDILYYDVFSKMNIFLEWLGRLDSSIKRFSREPIPVEPYQSWWDKHPIVHDIGWLLGHQDSFSI